MTYQLTIEYGDDVLLNMRMRKEELDQEARCLLAAKLYELGRLSSGKAAQLCGMDRVTFLLSLHRVDVAAINLDERDLEDDFRYARGE
jgi:predicted HTH domain antitoxin